MVGSELLGVWIVKEIFVEDVGTNVRRYPAGSDPKGVLILHDSGRMAGLITPRNQPPVASEADMANVYRTTLAYSGRFRFEAPNKFITSVDTGTYPHWIGTDQVRHYSLDGDLLTVLTDPTTGPNGEQVVGGVSFVRETL